MTLPARCQRVELCEAWRVFVAHDEIRLLSAQPVSANHEVVLLGRGQGLGEQDAALQIIDVVIERRPQVDDARDEPGVLVAQLDADALRAGQDVLVAQEVERPAGASELIAARDGARLRGEGIERDALLAEVRGGIGLPVRIAAVEPAIDVRELVLADSRP